MTRYIAMRTLIVVASVIGLITISFGLVSLIPGDPAVAILGDLASDENIARLNAELGLDKPLAERYWVYMTDTLRGDLGESYFTGQSITRELATRMPSTLLLIIPGLALALALGLGMGLLAAYFRQRIPDRIANTVFTVLQSIPQFVLGVLLLYVLYTVLRVAPAPTGMLDTLDVVPREVTGSVPIDAVLTGSWSVVRNIMARAILPVLTIGGFFLAYFGKTVRTGAAQALASPQAEFARACGLPERTVCRYALTDVRTSLLTFLAILFGASLGGAAIVEVLFSWPGIGQWSLTGVIRGDVPVIQGFVLVYGTLTLVAYLVLDILVYALDPRVRARVQRGS